MAYNSRIKKTIAKEVLLFFAALCIWALVCLGLFFRSTYYIAKSSSLNDEFHSTHSQLDSLPKDKIKALYKGVDPYLVVQYQVEKDAFEIPKKDGTPFISSIAKKDEQVFLKDFPKAKRLQANSKGYSKGLPIFRNDPLGILKDSIYEFDFVTLQRFKEFLKNKDYKNNFYNSFSNEFDLGNLSEFDTKIKEGLNYTVNTDIARNKLTRKVTLLKKSIYNAKASTWSEKETRTFMFYTALVLLIILYPFRLGYLLLKWALMTLRQG